MSRLKRKLGVEVSGRQVSMEDGGYVLREPDSAYNVHFAAEQDLLSMDNEVYFDKSEIESTG